MAKRNRPAAQKRQHDAPPRESAGPTVAAMMAPTTEEPLIGPTDVALMLGVPVSWIYAKSEAGDLPSFKVGHYRRFKRSEIKEYLLKCRSASRS